VFTQPSPAIASAGEPVSASPVMASVSSSWLVNVTVLVAVWPTVTPPKSTAGAEMSGAITSNVVSPVAALL